MTREEAIEKYVIPAIERTWNEKTCKKILEALEQQSGEPQKGNVYLSREAYGDLCFAASKWNELEICGSNRKYVRRDKTCEWIPISKRLPKEGQEVLVSCCTTSNKRVIISRYQGEQCGFTCGLVSAWMPLPKLYKSESESEEQMSGENPCKVCKAKDMASGCRNCVLDTIAVSRECYNDECFLNYECGCLLSLDEDCKASTAYPDSIEDHFCDECVNYKESKDGECICKEGGQEIYGYDAACKYFEEIDKVRNK